MGVVCVGVKQVEAIGFGMHSTAGLEQVTVAVLSHVMAVQAKGGRHRRIRHQPMKSSFGIRFLCCCREAMIWWVGVRERTRIRSESSRVGKEE